MRNAEQNLDLSEARDEKYNKPNAQSKDSPSEWIIWRENAGSLGQCRKMERPCQQ